MKRHRQMFQKIWGVIFFLAFSPAAWAYDYDFYTGGIYYDILSSNNKTVAVAYGREDYSGDVTIPATVSYNGTVYSVITIGSYTFSYCEGLTSITIPESVQTIGEAAFEYCKSLTSVTIPESVTAIGECAFSCCSGLVNFDGKFATADHRCLVINDTLIAFSPSGLTQYTIPDGVKVIGERAFSSCGLTTVTIPESVTAIGDEAFSSCGLTSVTIPNGVTAIGSSAFSGCRSLTSVTIPDGVTTIGIWAFQDCSGLTSVTIGDGVTSIDNYAFYGCSGLTSVTIGESVTTIGEKAFLYCRGLTSVIIPDSVTVIGSSAFAYCENLTEVAIGENVQTIGWLAFEDCDGLTSVTIPESVQTIGWWAFHSCENLTSVTIGNGVITIGDAAFGGCDGLTSVTAYNPTPVDIGFSVFDNVIYKNCTLYVPAESVEAYREEWWWFEEILPIVAYDFEAAPTITPAENDETITALSTFMLTFDERPALVGSSATVMKADSSIYYPARITASENGKSFIITLQGDEQTKAAEYSLTETGTYLLVIPAGTFGDDDFAADPKTGHSNPELTYTYTIKEDFMPTGITPEDGSVVTELKTFTLEFTETPNLAAEAKTIALAGNDTMLTATLAAGEGNTLEITLADTLKAAGEYTLTIPEGSFGDALFASDPTTGHCNPALTYTYTVKEPVVQDFKPTGITPTDNSEVEALKTFTLEFTEMPSLAAEAQPITLAGKDTLLTATLAAGEKNTLVVTLADTLKVADEYTLTIPEGAFGDADFADDPAFGRCNPELVYTYTIKEPEPVEPDEPDEPSSITETQQDAEHVTVYNLQGVLVLEADDAAALRTLPAGAYIVNGKTMIIAR